MKRTLQKIIHVLVGVILVIFGILGLILPVLNGIIFLILGLIIISFESAYVEKNLARITRKNKRVHDLHNRLDKFLRKILKR